MNPGHAARAGMRRFGVRQLAAALSQASLLATDGGCTRNPEEQARAEKSGSKLPHSKASHLRFARKLRRYANANASTRGEGETAFRSDRAVGV